MKPSIPDLKKQLVDEGADIDAMIAEFPEEEVEVEAKTDLSTESDDAGLATKIHDLLMQIGPPDRWTVDIMKTQKPDFLAKASEAYDKMSDEEKGEIQRAWNKLHNVNARPPGVMSMRME